MLIQHAIFTDFLYSVLEMLLLLNFLSEIDLIQNLNIPAV